MIKFTENSDVENTSSSQEVESHISKPNCESSLSLPVTEAQPRRSGRIIKTPKWMEDYVPT